MLLRLCEKNLYLFHIIRIACFVPEEVVIPFQAKPGTNFFF